MISGLQRRHQCLDKAFPLLLITGYLGQTGEEVSTEMCAQAAEYIISLFQSSGCKYHSKMSVKQLYLKEDEINVLREKPDGQTKGL